MAVKSYTNYPAPLYLIQGCKITNIQTTLDGTTCFAYSFIPTTSPFTGGLSIFEVRAYFSTAVGNPKVTAYVYSDNPTGVVPNALITNGTGVESGVLGTGFASLTWTGTLPAVVVGTRYWIVLKLTAGTSIRVNFQTVVAQFFSIYGTIGGANGRGRVAQGADGAWAGTSYNDVENVRIGFTDGTDTAYTGLLVSGSASTINAAGFRIDGTKSVGTVLTVPSSLGVRIRSIPVNITRVGTPGNISCVVYKGSSVVVERTSVPRISTDIITAANTVHMFDFNPALELSGNTLYRCVFSAASGSNAANYYYLLGYPNLYDTNAASLALPGWSNHLTQLDGGVWTDSTSYLINFGVILDQTTGPFISSGSGGGSTNIVVGGSGGVS